MARILVIGDEQDDEQVAAMHQQGHTVTVVSCQHALRVARDQLYDALLVPDAETCRALRAAPATEDAAILVVTSGDEAERLRGLEAGADDCVAVPFSVRELALRVRAVMRRAALKATPPLLELGCLRIDVAGRRVWVRQRPVCLTAVELKLLVALHDRRNRVTTREALLEQVWGTQPSTMLRTVDSYVRHVREKLGEAGSCIETVRGVGYRLVRVD